jgi:hypothetical protein
MYRNRAAGLPRLQQDAVTGLPSSSTSAVVSAVLADLDGDRDMDVVLTTTTAVYVAENTASSSTGSSPVFVTRQQFVLGFGGAGAVVFDADNGARRVS